MFYGRSRPNRVAALSRLSCSDNFLERTMDRRTPPPLRLHVRRWFNTSQPIALDDLRGKVVAIHAFQMLCPACVSHGLPQTARLREIFPESDLAVIGLHTVFEHHAVMGEGALEAFIHEYRLRFPIGVDQPSLHGPIPKTMAEWGLQGTPSLMLLDKSGRLRLRHFGRIDDLALGAAVGQLIEQAHTTERPARPALPDGACDGDACAVASSFSVAGGSA
jgi:hypothetical protein